MRLHDETYYHAIEQITPTFATITALEEGRAQEQPDRRRSRMAAAVSGLSSTSSQVLSKDVVRERLLDASVMAIESSAIDGISFMGFRYGNCFFCFAFAFYISCCLFLIVLTIYSID